MSGSTKSKKAQVIVIALVCAIVASAVVTSRFVPWQDLMARAFMRGMFIYVQRKRVRLLCETDHKALLEACRELSKQKAAGKLKRQLYRILSGPDPEVVLFPKAIRKLRPNTIFIGYDGWVKLEMMGGLESFGVKAYPEDYEKPPSAATLGDKKLIDGLWYYDEDYTRGNLEYQKRIDALIEKGKARQR